MPIQIDFQTLTQHSPFAQYQLVDVTFGDAYADTEIRHTLQPPTPEHIHYYVLDQAQAAVIYRDLSGTRKPWRAGVITLRSSVANARVKLLLFVAHEKQPLLETSPTSVIPAVSAHVHDAADITSGVLNVARIPSLPASQITSGTLDVARIPDLDAAKIISGTLADARIPSLDASKITTGNFAKSFLPSAVAYEDEANTFSALNTFSVKPEMTLGLTERGRATAMGEWTAVTYNGANFTADVGTWTVESGDQITFAYTIVGKTLTVSIELLNTSLSSTPSVLSIPLPGGFTANRSMRSTCIVQNGTNTIGMLRVVSGSSIMTIFKDASGSAFVSATNTFSLYGQLVLEVQ